MTSAATQLSLALPEPAVWTPPAGKRACGRDPAMGPGTCWWWSEGCPRPEARGCHLAWQRRQVAA